MKKKTHYQHWTSFRYGNETDYQIGRLKEYTKCNSTTKIIRKAIEHYYAWETFALAEEERMKSNGK